MSYPPAVDRRARRRRILAILLLLVAAVAVVALAVSYRTERRETADFLAVAQEVAEAQLDISTSLSDLMTSIGDLERPDILLRLETLAADGRTSVEQLGEAVVPRPVAKPGGLLSVAVGNWADGVAAIEPAFMAVLDAPEDDPLGDQMLLAAFDMLEVGDVAYRQFLVAVVAIDSDVDPGEFPSVAFASGENDPLFDAETISSRLRLTRKLDERHDVGITATIEPEPVTDPAGVQVLPLADSYDIVAVVSNEGNVGEEAIEVGLDLESNDGSVDPIELTQLLPFLEPGEADTVIFEDLSLTPGRFYQLRLTVSIINDDELDDNVFELPFFTNEAE